MVDEKERQKSLVVLCGSPQPHGNSSTVAQRFADGAKEAGHAVQRFDVAKLHIGGCLGCGQCQRNGGVCVQDDDMARVREALRAADAVLLASPVYFYGMSSQLKAVVDRSYAFIHEQRGKAFYFVLAGSAPDESYFERPVDALRGWTDCVPDSHVDGVLLATGCQGPHDVDGSAVLNKAYEMGRAMK